MISASSRAEFEGLTIPEVQKKVDAVSYGPEKQREAVEWLQEQDPARKALALAEAAGVRATTAIIISLCSILVAVLLFALPYWIGKPH
jgi:hypothetical protein